MSRLSRSLAGLAAHARLAPTGGPTPTMKDGWRAPLDESLLRRLERLSLAPRRPATSGLGGEHRSRARASSTDFADYRPYLPGDDFRQIDWNAYGRLDQLYVRLTEARERVSLRLLLDCSASMDAGQPRKLDVARQMAAALGYVGLARYDHVELVWLGGAGPTARTLRGKQRFGELLGLLGRVTAAGGLDADAALPAALTGGSGLAVLISDMLHPSGYAAGLDAAAASGFDLSLIQVLSPQELSPDFGGDLELADVESGEVIPVGVSPTALATYRRRLEGWCEAVGQACRARGLRYLRLTTDEPLERAVLVRLREAGVVR